jgi:RNA polymerase sigma-70 factor (ECF subfamily)
MRRREALAVRMSEERLIDDRQSEALSAEEAVVHEALGRLSERDREVLLLVEWEGLRSPELSEVLECLEVTARGRLHRARLRFRDAFEAVLSEQSDLAADDEVVDLAGLAKGRFVSDTRKAQP